MNRIIKFRAWFKEEKEMRDVAMLRWENDRLCRIAGYWKGTKDNGWTDYDPAEDKIELMQFTDLYDRTGKEIYEGDILVADMYIRNKWTEGVKLKVVYYSSGIATQSSFRFERDNGSWEYEALLNDTEVIGNIYENPNLIK